MSAAPAPQSYWFEQSSDREPAGRLYLLRALDDHGQDEAHRAPLGEEDRALVERLRAGEMDAFEQLYRAHADGLIGFAARLCGSRAAAQDVVGDLFVHLWERRTEWNPRSGLRAYLYAAIRHRASDRARSERRATLRAERTAHDPSLSSAPISADAHAELADEVAAVWRIVDTFPPLRRQIMYLRWTRGLSPSEVAAVVGLSRGAVDQHLSRAVRAIRDAVVPPPTAG